MLEQMDGRGQEERDEETRGDGMGDGGISNRMV